MATDCVKTEIQTTADGSATLYRPDIDEHYHSVKGALSESRHVYIGAGLAFRAQAVGNSRPGPQAPLRVVEIGFGTGLDAMLAAEFALATATPVSYLGLDTVAVDPHTLRALSLDSIVGGELFDFVTSAPWNTVSCHSSQLFTLEKRLADATCFKPDEGSADVIFMDAFAPGKQPAMWTDDFIALLARWLAPGGVLTTYCAKGAVRRAFVKAGLEVERLEGPAGGKREILRATKPIVKPC